jgi:hypothetical protein
MKTSGSPFVLRTDVSATPKQLIWLSWLPRGKALGKMNCGSAYAVPHCLIWAHNTAGAVKRRWASICSGLVSMAYLLNGVIIYRMLPSSRGLRCMKFHLKQQSRAICCFFPGHVAMYLGEGRFVHSTGHTGTEGVILSSLAEEAPDYGRI